ncbi:hypothetical protein MKW92_017823 [Papaver armeniacum]|nr:hypothetical protein MKW92_017823 [Papaver armeniacum]
MGRLKIEIEKINDPKKRIVTFSKRRGGIKSKAAELCKLFPDINVCIIVFSPGGRAFTFTNSPLGVCNMVEQFLKEETKDKKQENKNVHVQSHKGKNSTTHVHECRDKAGVGSTDSFWWDNIDVEELDSAEKLKSVRQSLAKLKQNLSARKEKLTASSSSSSSPSSSSTNEDSILVEDSDHEDCKIVEDAATSITEKHDDAGKTSSTDHPNLDLSLGW